MIQGCPSTDGLRAQAQGNWWHPLLIPGAFLLGRTRHFLTRMHALRILQSKHTLHCQSGVTGSLLSSVDFDDVIHGDSPVRQRAVVPQAVFLARLGLSLCCEGN